MNPRLRIETWGTRLNCATKGFTATGYWLIVAGNSGK